MRRRERKALTYGKGDKVIDIEMQPFFGKRPELYVGNRNELVKVASFSNEKKAKMFEEWLQYFFGVSPVKEGD